MRILHLGTGYFPIAGGGLTRYAFDLMEQQVAQGHDVNYLCVGDFTLLGRTRVVRWRRNGVLVHEIRDPRTQNIHLARQRDVSSEISDPLTESLLASTLRRVRPDAVHVQGLVGWPASVARVIRQAGTPSVMTVQNYHLVCPTARLYDELTEEHCCDFHQGRRCQRCNGARPDYRKLILARRYRPVVQGLTYVRNRILRRSTGRCRAVNRDLPPTTPLSTLFADRRRAFVGAANQIDLVVGMSTFVTDTLVSYGVAAERLRTLGLTLSGLSAIRKRPALLNEGPINFAFLNKLAPVKGSHLLAKAFARVHPQRVKLHIYGHQNATGVSDICELVDRGIAVIHGSYTREGLQEVLDGIDVGMVPSVWAEPYGYVGLEFLAAGIPVLGSKVGGIPDYVRHNENGLLLPAEDPGAWSDAISRLSSDPSEVVRLSRGCTPPKSMQEHSREMLGLYHEARERHARAQ